MLSGNVSEVQVPAHDADSSLLEYILFRQNTAIRNTIFHLRTHVYTYLAVCMSRWDHAAFLVSSNNIYELINLDRLIKHSCAPMGRWVSPCNEYTKLSWKYTT